MAAPPVLPAEVLHALYRWCATDARALGGIAASCKAWRDASNDIDLWKDLIARRWGPESVDMDGCEWNDPQRESVDAWRAVYFARAVGRRLQRTALESMDLNEVLGRRLAPGSFFLHHTGWAVYTLGGKTMAAGITSANSFISLGFTAKVLATAGNSGGGGSFCIGRAGEAWDTDGVKWLVVRRTHRNALALFSIPDAGFSHGNNPLGCSGAGGAWSSCDVFPEVSAATSIAVCPDRLASVSKLSKGKGSQLRVRALARAPTRISASPAAHRSDAEILSVCWLARDTGSSEDSRAETGVSRRLACGTGGGEVLIFDATGTGLEQLQRLSPSGAGLSRIEGLRFCSLGRLAVLEYRHGPRVWGGELRVWVCEVDNGERGSWQRVLAPKMSGTVAGDNGSQVTDAVWYEDSLLLLHRAGSASLHVCGPGSKPEPCAVGGAGGSSSSSGNIVEGAADGGCALNEWRACCCLPHNSSMSKAPWAIASLSRAARCHGEAGSGRRGTGQGGAVVIAGDSSVVHVHVPVVW